MRHLLLIFAFLLAAVGLSAQASTVFTEANAAYHRGMDFFNQNLYGLAQKEFRTVMEMLRPVNEPEWKAVKTDAELHHAKCAVRLGQPEAEKWCLTSCGKTRLRPWPTRLLWRLAIITSTIRSTTKP